MMMTTRPPIWKPAIRLLCTVPTHLVIRFLSHCCRNVFVPKSFLSRNNLFLFQISTIFTSTHNFVASYSRSLGNCYKQDTVS